MGQRSSPSLERSWGCCDPNEPFGSTEEPQRRCHVPELHRPHGGTGGIQTGWKRGSRRAHLLAQGVLVPLQVLQPAKRRALGTRATGGHPWVPKITAAAPETAPGAGRKDGPNTLGTRGMLGARAGDGKGTAKGWQRDGKGTRVPRGPPEGAMWGSLSPGVAMAQTPTGEKPRVAFPRRRRHKAAPEGGGKRPARCRGGATSPQPHGEGQTTSPGGAQCDPPTETGSPTAKAGPCGRPPRNASACRDGGRDVCGASGTGGSPVAAVSPGLLPERKETGWGGGVPIAHPPPPKKYQ